MSQSTLPAGRRELTRSHIAFYRAVIEGIDSKKAWDLYLHVDGDWSEVHSNALMTWVRQALIMEAVAMNEPGLIGLFRRDPQKIIVSSNPTLDEFIAGFEDASEFGENEMLELWKAEYGESSPSEERRKRLMRRLQEALVQVEARGRSVPAPEDSVRRWLAPGLAQKLLDAGIDTLGKAAQSLDSRRTQRWEEVPGIGQVWADRLAAWLSDSGIQAAPKPQSLTRQLAPFELEGQPTPLLPSSVPAPEALPSSSHSAIYGRANQLNARTDRDVIQSWLNARATNPNTLRSYRKAGERLLLWCQYERQISMLDMQVPDCIHYKVWLADLGRKSEAEWLQAGWKIQQKDWVGPRAAERNGTEWRPFAQSRAQVDKRLAAQAAGKPSPGFLSSSSVAQDLLVIRSLYDFVLKSTLIPMNPWDLVGKQGGKPKGLAAATFQFTSRSFNAEEWRFLIEGLDSRNGDRQARLLAILWLGYGCGLRASEMIGLKMGSILPDGDRWKLVVNGKGEKLRVVPLPSPVRSALLQYMESIGLGYDEVVRLCQSADKEELEQPVLRGQRGRRSSTRTPPTNPLGYTTLFSDVKSYFERRAKDMLAASGDPAARKLSRASAHWLRHTCATLSLKSGLKLQAVQKLLGHESITTTQIYITEDEDALQDAMEAFTTR